jgi:hypothetical protein
MRKTNLERLLRGRPDGIFVGPFEVGEFDPALPRRMGLEGLVSTRLDLALPRRPLEGLDQVEEPRTLSTTRSAIMARDNRSPCPLRGRPAPGYLGEALGRLGAGLLVAAGLDMRNARASFLVLAHQIVQEMRFWKITFILSALATIATPVSTRGDDGVDTSYEACSTACVATAHKCLDQITVDLSQRRADRIRTQCGETLDGCVTACQDSAANAFQKGHPTIIGSPPH